MTITFHTDQKHSLFSPSSTFRWSKCFMSLNGEDSIPNESSIRGTFIHGLAEKILRKAIGDNILKKEIDGLIIKELSDIDAEEYKNNCTDLLQCHKELTNYIHYIKGCLEIDWFPDIDRITNDKNFIFIEEKVVISEYFPNHFGTLDFGVINTNTEILHIVDLKTGQVEVDINDNLQLMSYAYGLCNKYYNEYNFKEVNIHIVSGINGNKSVEYDPEDLMKKMNEFFLKASVNYINNHDKAFPGEYCIWCDNKANCPIIKSTIEKIVSNRDNSRLSFEHKEQLLRMKSTITSFFNKLQVEMESVILEKEMYSPKYFKVVSKPGRNRWKVGSIDYLKNHSSSNNLIEMKPVSIDKAKRYLNDQELNDLTEQPIEKILVPNDKEVVINEYN